MAGRVHSVWCQRTTEPRSQLVVPDGCADILWHDGHLCVAGPDTSWRMAQMPPGSMIMGIRFRPGGAAGALFGDMPVSEARDGQPFLADLWGDRPVRELTERLAAADSPAVVLQAAVVARLSHVGDVDPVVTAAVRLFDVPRPPSVADVADRFGLCDRQFRRRFVHTVGYGPATLVGVLRMRRAMRLFESPARPADVAAAAGYADQPHMTRELRRLTGVTPGQLRR